MGLRRILASSGATILIAGVVSALSATVASASISDRLPDTGRLYAETDGVNQGMGYGYYGSESHNGTKFGFDARLYDLKVGGEPIYGEMLYQYKECDSGCTWDGGDSDQTPRWSDNAWSGFYHEHSTPPSFGAYGRGLLRVCEDQSFSGDDCSGWEFSSQEPY